MDIPCLVSDGVNPEHGSERNSLTERCMMHHDIKRRQVKHANVWTTTSICHIDQVGIWGTSMNLQQLHQVSQNCANSRCSAKLHSKSPKFATGYFLCKVVREGFEQTLNLFNSDLRVLVSSLCSSESFIKALKFSELLEQASSFKNTSSETVQVI